VTIHLLVIFPKAVIKMVDKSRINETYSLMKNSILSLTLILLHDLKTKLKTLSELAYM
jgi:hypothetical protein